MISLWESMLSIVYHVVFRQVLRRFILINPLHCIACYAYQTNRSVIPRFNISIFVNLYNVSISPVLCYSLDFLIIFANTSPSSFLTSCTSLIHRSLVKQEKLFRHVSVEKPMVGATE